MAKITVAVNQDKRDLHDAVVQAFTDLDAIIAEPSWTQAKAVQAILKLAQHQKKIIKRLVQLA